MAPSKSGSGRSSRSIALPSKFKCAVGGEWKPASEFSQNQLNLWTQRKRHDNDGVTSVNIGLVCRVHTGEPQLSQIKCQGPCNQRKHREAFSKAQRNRPDAWCKRCTEWKERYQGDVIPGAAPNNNVSQDEKWGASLHQGEEVAEHTDDDDDDGDIDDDGDDGDEVILSDNDDGGSATGGTVMVSIRRSMFQNPYFDTEADGDEEDMNSENVTYMSDVSNGTVGGRRKTRTAHQAHSTYQASQADTVTTDGRQAPRPTRPTYATISNLTSTNATATTSQAASTSTRNAINVPSSRQGTASLPPHIRAIQNPRVTAAPDHARANLQNSVSSSARPCVAQSSVASIDSRDGIQSFTSTSVASVDTRPMERQTYNAFDPHGDMHIKSTGGTSEYGTKTTASSSDRRVKTGRSGWAKGDNRKRFDVAPAFSSIHEEHVENYDSSGSEDEM